MKIHLDLRQGVSLGIIQVIVATVWLLVLHDYSLLGNVLGVCAFVTIAMSVENYSLGLKRQGKKLYFIKPIQAYKEIMVAMMMVLSIAYVSKLPFEHVYVSYGLCLGLVAVAVEEWGIRKRRTQNVHVDIVIMADRTHCVGSNIEDPVLQRKIQELNDSRLTDFGEVTEIIFAIFKNHRGKNIKIDTESSRHGSL